MKLFVRTLSALLLAMSPFSTAALADTYSVEVAAGRTTQLRSFSLFNDVTCEFGPKPSVQFRQPANGKISVAWGVVGFEGKGPCKKANIRGFIVSYTPKPGFRGKDTGKVYFSYLRYGTSGNKTDSMKFDLTVK